MDNLLYTCPCCGYKTLGEEPPGTYEICDICFWEDDPVQFKDTDYEGGANIVSLRQAQKNFIKLGAMDIESKRYVKRLTPDIKRDLSWKPLD